MKDDEGDEVMHDEGDEVEHDESDEVEHDESDAVKHDEQINNNLPIAYIQKLVDIMVLHHHNLIQ